MTKSMFSADFAKKRWNFVKCSPHNSKCTCCKCC